LEWWRATIDEDPERNVSAAWVRCKIVGDVFATQQESDEQRRR